MSTAQSLILSVQGERAERLGARREQEFDCRDGSIGRAEECDWTLGAEGVSRLHALVRYLNGLYFIEDRSTNGVLLNGTSLRRGEPAALKHGDRLQIDTFEIDVRLTGETATQWNASPDSGRSEAGSGGSFAAHSAAHPAAPYAASASAGSAAAPAKNIDPLDLSLLLAPRRDAARGDAGHGEGLIPGTDAASGASLDPLAMFDAPSSYGDEAQQSQPPAEGWNHTPAVSDRFRPPQVEVARENGAMLPDDWDMTGSRVASRIESQWDVSLPAASPVLPAAFVLPASADLPDLSDLPVSQPDVAVPPQSFIEQTAGIPDAPASVSLPLQPQPQTPISALPSQQLQTPTSGLPSQQSQTPTPGLPSQQSQAPTPGLPSQQSQTPISAQPLQQPQAPMPALPLQPLQAPMPALPSQQPQTSMPALPSQQPQAPAPATPSQQLQVPISAMPSQQLQVPTPAMPLQQLQAPTPALPSQQPQTPASAMQPHTPPLDTTPDPASPPAPDLNDMFHIAVDAMMDVLRARAELKNSFRLPATLIQRSENNPLKFAPTAQEAVRKLFAPPDQGFLSGSAALNDAAADIRNHQMAMLAGVRSAFQSMLAHFDPAPIEASEGGGARRLSLGGRPRHWERYKEQFEALTRNPDECFRRLFGDEFARAYEEQLARLKSRRD
jgi:type VI secretion system FHA domain protein